MAEPVWFPSAETLQRSRLYRWMTQQGFQDYDQLYQASIGDIAWFWGEAEKAVGTEWFEPYTQTLDLSRGMKWPEWFAGGKLNAVHNALDKWLRDPASAGRLALVWEREDGAVEKYTYRELAARVNRVADGLKRQGVRRGDRIGIYLPMIPETVVAVLAIAKIGAVFTAAYSGFGADPIAKRLASAQAKMLITADGQLRRGKFIPMKEAADQAAELAGCVEKVVVVRRHDRKTSWRPDRDVDWAELETGAGEAPTERMGSMDPFVIIYTSGTTGRPKGTVHTHGSFAIRAAFEIGYNLDLHPGETLFWLTDMGWVMGPIVVFGALANGGAVMLYEGAPDYPRPDRLWAALEKHRVSLLGIAPTLIRSIMQYGEELPGRFDLSSLQGIASTGEPWDPRAWMWLFEKVGRSKVPILNISGGTEIGGGIVSNTLLKPIAPGGFNSALLGMDADVYDPQKRPVRGAAGELVIRQPWLGMTHGFWQEPERYENTYWTVWDDTWIHGDAVLRDADDFWTIIGRSDDTLNVAGKRMGPAEIELILVDHPAVMEAGVIGVPDELKGEVPVCFVVLNEGQDPGGKLHNELMQMVTDRLGKSLRPKELHFVTELPKTRSAKIMRRAIRAAYLNQDPGDLSSLDNPESIGNIRAK
ncbi:AMP-binding protein [Brevibacillus massiliensis]|uniref:AMP-binding protein n=1 Tax=Brevibacillus massiliensis TaxID=1118054 RepID=UPI0002DCFECF|nr:AMP-binding protein [Brevibacillus massiliensis]